MFWVGNRRNPRRPGFFFTSLSLKLLIRFPATVSQKRSDSTASDSRCTATPPGQSVVSPCRGGEDISAVRYRQPPPLCCWLGCILSLLLSGKRKSAASPIYSGNRGSFTVRLYADPERGPLLAESGRRQSARQYRHESVPPHPLSIHSDT